MAVVGQEFKGKSFMANQIFNGNVSKAVLIQNLHEIDATPSTIAPRTEMLPETPTQIMLRKV